ncbi:Protein osb1, mitochondrial-like [Castilleja foliolosa]
MASDYFTTTPEIKAEAETKTFWDELARVAFQHVEKGQQVYVSGALFQILSKNDDGKQQTYFKMYPDLKHKITGEALWVEGRYPKMSEEAFAEACPVCQKNCNCKACLRMKAPAD